MLKLTFCVLTLLSSLHVVKSNDGLKVSTNEGPVVGTLPIPTVRQFLGIPYAVAKRWEGPKPVPKRTVTFNASSFSDSCPQALNPENALFFKLAFGSLKDSEIFVPESEECQSVNIWAPAVDRKQKTAVLVWIYGGAFQFGTTNTPAYHGLNIVRDNDDTTLVSFNYRTNIFGQPNAPQLNKGSGNAQNFGLLDMDTAIQWVHKNIEAFGGDPERITILGQSAGSRAAELYALAHPNDTIVKGVIQQSGSALGSTVTTPNQTIDPTGWNTVSIVVGCGNTTDATQFSCMQAVNTTTLAEAVRNTNATFGLVEDGVTLFNDSAARVAAGNFLRVPLLSGSTLNEGDLFVVDAELAATGSNGLTLQPFTDIVSSITTLGYTCEMGQTASFRRKAGVPAWRYQYQAVFPNLSPRPDLRAYHTSEIPLIFGTYNNTENNISSTATEIALSRLMQTAWVSFARDPTNGLSALGWPLYNETETTLVQLGNFMNATGFTLTNPGATDLFCGDRATFEGISAQVQNMLNNITG